MYEIIYKIGWDFPKYLLTDKEFAEAQKCWESNNNYFCKRIEAMLSPRPVTSAKQRHEVGCEVFIKTSPDKTTQKIYKKPDGTYHTESINEENKIMLSRLFLDKRYLKEDEKMPLTEKEIEFIKSLIPQDYFYEKKMNVEYGE